MSLVTDGAVGRDASVLRLANVPCPECGNAKPQHQPLCYECATTNPDAIARWARVAVVDIN